MKKKQKKPIKELKSLKNLSWDEISYELIKLNSEFEFVKNSLNSSEIELYQQFISHYEQEKANRHPKKRDYTDYMNGPRSAIVEWLEVEIEDFINPVFEKKGTDTDWD